MTPGEFLQRLSKERASAILRTGDHELARLAMEAAVRGGFRVVEFTLTIPGVFELIKEFAAKPDLVVGAGTVLTEEDADAAVNAGAQFLVSPVKDLKVIARATKLNVASVPGCSTPTELLDAYRAGATLQKLFPEQGIGPAFLRQVLGPLPFLKIVPTSGVTLANAAEYLRAGAYSVGFVNSLFEPLDIANRNWAAISARASDMLKAVKSN